MVGAEIAATPMLQRQADFQLVGQSSDRFSPLQQERYQRVFRLPMPTSSFFPSHRLHFLYSQAVLNQVLLLRLLSATFAKLPNILHSILCLLRVHSRKSLVV